MTICCLPWCCLVASSVCIKNLSVLIQERKLKGNWKFNHQQPPHSHRYNKTDKNNLNPMCIHGLCAHAVNCIHILCKIYILWLHGMTCKYTYTVFVYTVYIYIICRSHVSLQSCLDLSTDPINCWLARCWASPNAPRPNLWRNLQCDKKTNEIGPNSEICLVTKRDSWCCSL